MMERPCDLSIDDSAEALFRDRLDFLRYFYSIDYDGSKSKGGFIFNALRIKDDKKVLVKISDHKDTRFEDGVEWPLEIAIHRHLKEFPMKVDLLEFCIFDDYYILVLEFPKHNINFKVFTKIIDSLSEVEVCYFQKLIVGVVAGLKKEGLEIRGLGIEDFLIDLHTATLKIWDFTNVRYEDDAFTYFGIPECCPPEYLQEDNFDYNSFMSWNLGVIFCSQLFKINYEDLISQIINKNFVFVDKLTKKSSDYILECFAMDPKHRIDINYHLKNEWIKDSALFFDKVSAEEQRDYLLCETSGDMSCPFCQSFKKFIYRLNFDI